MSLVLDLIRSPRAGAARVLETARLSIAAAAVALATIVAAANVARFSADVRVQDVMFGPERSPLVGTLLSLLGRDLTSVVLHLVEEAWAAVLVVTALGPLWIWLLGASAIHAAARLAAGGRPFGPMLVLFGLATGLSQLASGGVALLLGGRGPGAAVAQVVGLAALVWLGVVALRGIERHYGVARGRAMTILAIAVVLFYVVPLASIVVAVVAILLAAVTLDYFPTP